MGGNDAHRFAHIYQGAVGQVAPVALHAYPVAGLADQDGADLHPLNACLFNGPGRIIADHLPSGHQDFTCLRMHHIFSGYPAGNALPEGLNYRFAVPGELLDGTHGDVILGAAVMLPDDHILGHVHQPPGQITGVGCADGGVRQALAGTVAGDEELQYGEAFPEVGLDGNLKSTARGVRNQTAHARQLADLGLVTPGTRSGHHVNGVEIVEVVQHIPGDQLFGLGPDRAYPLVALFRGEQAPAVLLLDLLHFFFRGPDPLVLGGGNGDVGNGHRGPRAGAVVEAQLHDLVQDLCGLMGTVLFVKAVHQIDQLLFIQRFVNEAEVFRHDTVHKQAARGGLQTRSLLAIKPQDDLGMQFDGASIVSVEHLFHGAEVAALALGSLLHRSKVVQADDHVLVGCDDGPAAGGNQDVVGGEHQKPCFCLGLRGQGHVHRHLVAVEVRVVGGADQGMQLNRPAFHQNWLEGLDAQSVQGGGPVEQHGMLFNDLLHNVPHFRAHPVHHLLGAFDVVGNTLFHKLLHDKGLKQLQGHFLGQAALVEAQFRTDHNYGTAGIVHAFAQEVLAETPLLTLEHIAEGLQGPVARAGDRPAPAAVVDQGIHGLLEHALFVADDNVRSAQLQKSLEAVVAVDHPPVEIVEVGGGKPSAVQLHHGPELRRDHGDNIQNHPGGVVARGAEGLHNFQPPYGTDPALAGRLRDFPAQFRT